MLWYKSNPDEAKMFNGSVKTFTERYTKTQAPESKGWCHRTADALHGSILMWCLSFLPLPNLQNDWSKRDLITSDPNLAN